MSYCGKKFYPTGSETYYTEWGEKAERKTFGLTKSYIEYCREHQAEKERMKRITLKHKLEYQQKHYGEVDPIDLAEYMRLIQQSYTK